MKIEKLRIKNFKTLQNITIHNIPNFFVIVGANGSGKTTFFDIFGFLKDCLTYNVNRALENRGGFDQVFSRNGDGYFIEIEIQFRLKISDYNRLVTYILQINKKENSNQAIVAREILRYKRGPGGSPFHFIDFRNGSGEAVSNEADFSKKDTDLTREKQNLEPSILAIKGLGQFTRFKAATAFRQLIENWHVSDFHIDQARGSKDSIGYEEHLSRSGDNLQRVARNIKVNHPEIFTEIIEKMKERVPGIDDITTESTQDGRLLLTFKDSAFKEPFIDRYVSDGTIKMFAYLILLYDPNPHPLLCVEEPENQLYPTILEELAEEFESYTNKGGQIFVSTHSPDFLNAVKLDSVFWVYKKEGCSYIERASNNKQIAEYMERGDKMGRLWTQGFFKDVDPQDD